MVYTPRTQRMRVLEKITRSGTSDGDRLGTGTLHVVWDIGMCHSFRRTQRPAPSLPEKG